MKKYLTICAALLLGTSLVLAACGQDETPEETFSAVIPGDYHAPTAKELGNALTILEGEGEYIDGRPVGIEVNGLTMEAELGFEMQADGGRLAVSGSGNYDLYIENARTGASVGAGNLQLDATFTADGEQESSSASGNIYHDDTYLYLDVTEDGEVNRGKISYDMLPYLLEALLAEMQPGNGVQPLRGVRQPGIAQPLVAPSEETKAAEELLENLAAAGISVGLDDSDGLKLKLYANDDYFRMLEESAAGGAEGIEMTFPAKTLEVYCHVNQEHELEQLSAVVDLGYTLSYAGEEMSFSADFQLIAKPSEEQVTLPEDLSDEEKYPTIALPEDSVATVYYYSTDGFREMLYDDVTNTVTILDRTTYLIFDADTGTLLHEGGFIVGPTCGDVYDGKLCVGTGEAGVIRVIDLETFDAQTFDASCPVNEIVLMEDCIVYCNTDQWVEIYRCDLDGSNNALFSYESFYEPILTANRGDNMVYVAETGSSGSNLYYLDLTAGTVTVHGEFGGYFFNTEPAWYDGKTVHFYGNCFDSLTGEQISENELSESYPQQSGYDPDTTLLVSARYSFVKSLTGELLIFDQQAQQFIYALGFDPDAVYERPDGTFFVVGAQNGYAAIIDPAQI